jgi:hypothetical protein
VAYRNKPFKTAALVDEGKNGWVIRRALAEIGVEIVNEWPWALPNTGGSVFAAPRSAPDIFVIGTMSPGPMLDAWERRTLLNAAGKGPRLIAPWLSITHKPAGGSDILTGGRDRIPA